MNRYILKNIKKLIIVPGLLLAMILQTSTVNAAVYFEQGYKETSATGIVYENRLQATSAGLIDVSVLYVDINNAHVELKPIQSNSVYGAKEPVSRMVLESGAIAGVNADFFDMSLTPGTPFGDMIVDSKIVSTDENRPGYATFFMDDNNNPFIEYIEQDIQFLNNGQVNINVHAVNKYLRDFSAVYFDSNAIKNTQALDAKFPDLVKFVVRGDKITYISKGGETVNVPEDGYIILCAATYAQYFYNSVKVGDTAEFKVSSRFNYEKMNMAIGGAGKILENGNYSSYGYVVSPDSRQPRTAIGITQDGSKVILAVVDGRGYSIGATHEEMAEIMKNLGAWNAMHFDGGGSSTMVADTTFSDGPEVKNSPSGGAERAVINGLGVFHTAPVGEAVNMLLTVSNERVFSGNPVEVVAIGLDENNKKTVLPEGSVSYYSDDGGTWNGNIFHPQKFGAVSVYAVYQNMMEQFVIYNMDLAEIVPSVNSIKAITRESVKLTFEGISTDGYTAPLYNLSFEVVPESLGKITPEGVFTANTDDAGQGYIKCSWGDVVKYIDVTVGTRMEWITGFNDTNVPLEFLGSSTNVTGKTGYDDSVNLPGNYALKLTYNFEKSTSTQAAYLKFKEPIQFEDNLYAFDISVFMRSTNDWVRAKLIDASGHEFLVDVVKDLNYNGWGRFTVWVPAEAAQPVTLERLYVAALSNENTSEKSVYFDDLRAMYAAEFPPMELPQSNKFSNPFMTALSADKQAGHIDLTFVGDTVIHNAEERPENYIALQEKALKRFKQTADVSYFLGPSDIEGIEGLKRQNGYKFTLHGNYATIEMSGAKGSLSATYPGNWNFVNEAKATTAKHIIILTDRNPENYSNSKEYELLREALSQIRKTGKNVFIVSTTGFNTGAKVLEGVNYINLGALFNMDSSVNSNFKVLRIRINGDNIAFDLQGTLN